VLTNALIRLLSISGCGNRTLDKKHHKRIVNELEELRMKRAVIYYSLTENTKEAAEKIAEKLGADLFRIDTVKPMPEEFGKQMMYGGMQATFGLKPEITGVPENVSEYNEIIIGTPIWAGKNTPAINTLLTNKEIRDKVVAVFTLSGGGDNKKCMPKLEKKLANLKHSVALADKKLGKEAESAAKLEAFIEELING